LLAVKKIQDTNLICPVVVSQYAALACLRVGKNYSAQFLPEMAACRQQLLETLGQLSDYCRLVVPQGAFYCLLEVNSPLTDLELVKRLIDEFKVAVLPGSTFGVDSGCYLRIAYGALRQATASVAIARLEQGLKSIC
jgi:aspartate/methionine/tyrosine aminotransferase